MANTLISGQIGAGKSHVALEMFILPALRAGRHVYTNLDFTKDGSERGKDFIAGCRLSLYLKVDCTKLLVRSDFDKLQDYLILNDLEGLSLRVEKNSLIVIDEAQMIFDYMGVNRIDKRIYHFLSYARHFGFDLLFLTQDYTLLNKFVVNLCNQYIDITGMKQVSTLAKNKYVLEYHNRPGGVLLDKRIRTYSPDVFNLYRSYISTEKDIFSVVLPAGFWKAMFPLILAAIVGLYALKSLASGHGFFF